MPGTALAKRCVPSPRRRNPSGSRSPPSGTATSLRPPAAAARIAKKAYETGKTVRQVALEEKVLPEAKLKKLLASWSMTMPGLGPKADG